MENESRASVLFASDFAEIEGKGGAVCFRYDPRGVCGRGKGCWGGEVACGRERCETRAASGSGRWGVQHTLAFMAFHGVPSFFVELSSFWEPREGEEEVRNEGESKEEVTNETGSNGG